MRCARSAISSLALLALGGCGVLRQSDAQPICAPYEASIRPLVELRCGTCHSAERDAGGYVVGPYLQTLSRREDGTPRVIPGDDGSLFLRAARGELPQHTAVAADELKRLSSWVVSCRAAPKHGSFHPVGWSTPTDPEQFHGKALRASAYDFAVCEECHGSDLRGGASKVDCNGCHSEGPKACNTCHGDSASAAPPRDLQGARSATRIGVGAHRTHLFAGPLHALAFDCNTCHPEVKDEGHYRDAALLKTPAEVKLDAGTWSHDTATCANTYCHRPSKLDVAPTYLDPKWTVPGTLGCGHCHGNPPSTHQTTLPCEVCHGAGYADGGVDRALHVDGKVQLRGDGQMCDACHSGPSSPTFVDLKGRADAGAHDAHLHAHLLRGPLTCNECHHVPGTLLEPGHLDSAPPAEVFPRDEGGLAFKAGAMPVYDASNATCGSVYCHGGGDFGHPDLAPGLNRTPSWTGGPSQGACGSCHGLPPQDGTLGHTSGLSCDFCHGGTVRADGGIVFQTLPDGGLTSKHLDGKITGQ